MLHPECSVLPSTPRYLTEVNSRAGHRTDTGYLMCSSRVLSTSCGSLNPPRNLWDQLFCHFTDRKLEKQRNLPYGPVNWKKKNAPDFKAENCILFGKHAEDLSPKAASYNTLRDPSKEVREEGVKRHLAVFAKKEKNKQQKPGRQTIKNYC